MQWLQGKKTYLISALMVLVSLIHLVVGDMSLAQFVTSEHVITLLEATGLATLRAGVAKTG